MTALDGRSVGLLVLVFYARISFLYGYPRA